jgi:hypothetical protein
VEQRAVMEGLGEIVAAGARIWRRGVEKVLAFRADWMDANPDLVDRLLGAMSQAAAWCDAPANHAELAELLARPDYVGQPAEAILPALTGRLVLRPGEAPVEISDFLLFHREASAFPWRSQALWIYSQLQRWKMVSPTAGAGTRRGRRVPVGRLSACFGRHRPADAGREHEAGGCARLAAWRRRASRLADAWAGPVFRRTRVRSGGFARLSRWICCQVTLSFFAVANKVESVNHKANAR